VANAAQLIGLAVAVLSGLSAIVGIVIYTRALDTDRFWPLMRATQFAAIGQAVFAGVAAALGHRPDSALYWLYAALPVAVSLIAEQLRIGAAQSILDAHDLPDAQAVGKLDEAGQYRIVYEILRRELAVMAIAAAVICFLALRAASTATGL
jgi:hypothetical protein